MKKFPFKSLLKSHTHAHNVCMHTNIQAASQHSPLQTYVTTSSLAWNWFQVRILGEICYSFPHKFLYLPAWVYFPGKKPCHSLSMTNQIFYLWELRMPFFMEMSQFFQTCQFSSTRIHGLRIQSSPLTCTTYVSKLSVGKSRAALW